MVMNLSPSRSSTQGVIGSIGKAAASARIASKVEWSASRSRVRRVGKDQARPAGLLALEHVGGADPFGRRALALDDARLPVAGRALAQRRTKCRSGAPRGIAGPSARTGPGRWGPASSRARRARRPADGPRAARPEACDASAASGCGDRPTGIAVSSIVSRIAATRPGSIPADLGEVAVGLVDAPAGEHHGPGGKGHSAGALDHQHFAAARSRSRTRMTVAAGIGSALTPLTAYMTPAYMPATFCSWASLRIDAHCRPARACSRAR